MKNPLPPLNNLLYDSRKTQWGTLERRVVTAIMGFVVGKDNPTQLILRFGDDNISTANNYDDNPFGDDNITANDKLGSKHNDNSLVIRPPSLMSLMKILINPELYGLETYVKGAWSPVDCALVDVIAALTGQKNGFLVRWRKVLQKMPSLNFLYKHYIARIKSSRQTLLHYNVTAEFYEKLLHPAHIYSCAFFDSDEDSLTTAQNRKIDTIATRAAVPKTHTAKVLDIGCGWGATALRLAETYPQAHIDGISIAGGQIDFANEALRQCPPDMQKRVGFHLCDYRLYRPHEADIYDSIVSVGMLEHVGKAGYRDYFNHIYRLLKPGAKAAIHSIVRRSPGRTNRWIDKYVFPGGYIPNASEVLQGIENSGLRNLDCYIHDGSNYYKTLECWKQNLLKNYEIMLPMLWQKSNHESHEHFYDDYENFRRWYAYLSASQSFFLPQLEDGAVCHFVMQKPI